MYFKYIFKYILTEDAIFNNLKATLKLVNKNLVR
jgi:hypothetical protein